MCHGCYSCIVMLISSTISVAMAEESAVEAWLKQFALSDIEKAELVAGKSVTLAKRALCLNQKGSCLPSGFVLETTGRYGGSSMDVGPVTSHKGRCFFINEGDIVLLRLVRVRAPPTEEAPSLNLLCGCSHRIEFHDDRQPSKKPRHQPRCHHHHHHRRYHVPSHQQHHHQL